MTGWHDCFWAKIYNNSGRTLSHSVVNVCPKHLCHKKVCVIPASCPGFLRMGKIFHPQYYKMDTCLEINHLLTAMSQLSSTSEIHILIDFLFFWVFSVSDQSDSMENVSAVHYVISKGYFCSNLKCFSHSDAVEFVCFLSRNTPSLHEIYLELHFFLTHFAQLTGFALKKKILFLSNFTATELLTLF